MRARLLLAAPAAAALVFTGLSPASAHPHHDDRNHHGRYVAANVLDIRDRVRANDDGDRAVVRFVYRCRGNDNRIVTTVILRQGGDRLDRRFRGRLDCDGDRHVKRVIVRDRYDEVENGRARAVVKMETRSGRVLDRERERVRVVGVDDWRRWRR